MAAIRDESVRGEGVGRRVRPVPAVTRAVAILRLLGRSEEALGVHAIARALTLIPSTCLHILRVLVAEGLVAFDPETKRYRAGAGLLTIAKGVLRRPGFAELVQPELDRLSRVHGVTAIGEETWPRSATNRREAKGWGGACAPSPR